MYISYKKESSKKMSPGNAGGVLLEKQNDKDKRSVIEKRKQFDKVFGEYLKRIHQAERIENHALVVFKRELRRMGL